MLLGELDDLHELLALDVRGETVERVKQDLLVGGHFDLVLDLVAVLRQLGGEERIELLPGILLHDLGLAAHVFGNGVCADIGAVREIGDGIVAVGDARVQSFDDVFRDFHFLSFPPG